MGKLTNRSFTKLIDYSTDEINYLLDLSHEVKSKKKNNIPHKELEGKSVALIFQKDSTRTRCAFEVAAYDLGMKTVYLGPSGSQFGKKESVEDSAKVLGSMFDGIQFRGYKQSDVEELAKSSGVPVWNGLTDEWHPTQMIADFMTIQEEKGKDLKGLKFVYAGDGRNNMSNSLMITSAKLGVNFVCLAPKTLQPEASLIETAKKIAASNGSTIEMFEIGDKAKALKGADVIYTDVWVSMGETDWTSRLDMLHEYQVNMEMVELAKPNVTFLHCLPAFHGLNTQIGIEKAKEYGEKYPSVKNGEFEVTNAVIESKHCKAFQEAENRLHSIKAIMLATMK